MKKIRTTLLGIIMCLVLGMSFGLIACGNAGGGEKDLDAWTAGEYTMQKDGVDYDLEIQDNNDWTMEVSKNFGTYTVTKFYQGPVHSISGNKGRLLTVFLAAVEVDGTGCPDEEEALFTALNKYYGTLDRVDGETECRISLKTGGKFSVDSDTPIPADPTEGVWTIAQAKTDLDTWTAGTYKMTANRGAIVYELKIQDNNDWTMEVSRNFGTYTVTKFYQGPVHSISGNKGRLYTVFMSAVEIDGTGCPDEEEALEAAIKSYYSTLPKKDGETECRISLMINGKFSVDSDTPIPADPTDGVWSIADVNAKLA